MSNFAASMTLPVKHVSDEIERCFYRQRSHQLQFNNKFPCSFE